MDTQDTLEVESAPGPTKEQVDRVVTLARRQVMLERDIKLQQDAVAVLQQELAGIAERDLPEALSAAGIGWRYPVGNGWSVELEERTFGNISEARAAEAHTWMEEHGFGSLIKHVITVSFGKGEDTWARKFMRDLAQRKRPVNADRKDAVHGSTLGKFVRDNVATIPHELFGVYFKKTAKVVPPETEI